MDLVEASGKIVNAGAGKFKHSLDLVAPARLLPKHQEMCGVKLE